MDQINMYAETKYKNKNVGSSNTRSLYQTSFYIILRNQQAQKLKCIGKRPSALTELLKNSPVGEVHHWMWLELHRCTKASHICTLKHLKQGDAPQLIPLLDWYLQQYWIYRMYLLQNELHLKKPEDYPSQLCAKIKSTCRSRHKKSIWQKVPSVVLDIKKVEKVK